MLRRNSLNLTNDILVNGSMEYMSSYILEKHYKNGQKVFQVKVPKISILILSDSATNALDNLRDFGYFNLYNEIEQNGNIFVNNENLQIRQLSLDDEKIWF